MNASVSQYFDSCPCPECPFLLKSQPTSATLRIPEAQWSSVGLLSGLRDGEGLAEHCEGGAQGSGVQRIEAGPRVLQTAVGDADQGRQSGQPCVGADGGGRVARVEGDGVGDDRGVDPVQFGAASDGAGDRGPASAGELGGRRADPAEDAVDQHEFAVDGAVGEDGAVRGDAGDAQARAEIVGLVVGHGTARSPGTAVYSPVPGGWVRSLSRVARAFPDGFARDDRAGRDPGPDPLHTPPPHRGLPRGHRPLLGPCGPGRSGHRGTGQRGTAGTGRP